MKRKYLILFSLSGLVLSCDQLTKQWVMAHLPFRDSIEVIKPIFSIMHTHNVGFAFGMMKRVPQAMQDIFFIGIPVFAMILIILIFIKLQDDKLFTSIALTTILGGAAGNLIDRIKYGYVIDFLDFHWGNHVQLPPFNIADFSIILGVGIMFVDALLHARQRTGTTS